MLAALILVLSCLSSNALAQCDCTQIGTTGVPQIECEALVALYTSANGAGWTNNANWNTTSDINTWYGVTVVGGRADWIDLYNNQLTGAIPPELGNLANLQTLYLGLNQLTGAIPPELGNLANLRNLFLFDNQLTGVIPPELGNLANLRILNLGDNQLTGAIPPELGNPANLLRLHLYNNQLTGVIPPELGNLANLWWITLENNQLTGTIPPELGNLANLTSLSLYSNQLTGAIPPELGNLANLTSLSLYNNQLTGAIPPELGNLANLQTLILSTNQLTGAIPPQLGNLANLGDLNLSGNQLTGAIPTELGNLANLRYLYLSNNQLTGAIPPALGNLANLRRFDLSNNQLTGAIPSELGNLASLTDLMLFNNQLTGVIPTQLGNLANLQQLHLLNNQLAGVIPPELGNLANLRSLNLEINQLAGVIPPQLGNLLNLQSLVLRGNSLEGDIPVSFINLVNLNLAYLHYNELAASDPALIAFLNIEAPGWDNTQTIPPSNMGTADIMPTSVRVSWTPIVYTWDGGYYRVLYSTTPGGPYTLAGTTADKLASDFTVPGLTPGTTYYFVVETFTPAHMWNQNALTSAPSAEVGATTAGVSVTETAGNTNVTEGGATDTYTVALASIPTNPVAITVTPDGQLDFGAGAGTAIVLNFAADATALNPQTVTVTAANDLVSEGAHTGGIVHTAASADPGYNGIAIAGITANITDNDTPGVTVAQSGGSTNVTEGGATDTYTIALASIPINPVTITVTPNGQLNLGAGAGTAIVLNFAADATALNPQTVTVTAFDDAVWEGNHTGAITHTAASGDPGYDGIAIVGVTANITDNDNSPPTTTGIPNVTVNEDAADTVINLLLYFNDAQDGAAGLAYVLIGITNPGIFTTSGGSPSALTLSYLPNAYGASTLTIRATDTGGLFIDSAFTVNVNPVNDMPSFAASNPPAVSEDAGAQTIAGWAGSFNPGPNEAGQTVLGYVIGGISNPGLFSSGPSVNAAGTLTYTPAPNANGSSTFTAAVQDNGGTANGGVDTSPAQTFTITVNPVNDPPVLNAIGNQTVDEETQLNFTATATDTDTPVGSLTFSLDSGAPAGSGIDGATGQFSWTPGEADGPGTFTMTVRVTDGSLTDTETITITVNEVNTAPVLDNTGDMALAQIPENLADIDNPGTTVADIVLGAGGDRITDADIPANGEGVAVTGADMTNGVWQYDHDGDGVFTDFPAGLADDNAVLLEDTATIRFVPDVNYNGTSEITFRAWDRTAGTNGDTGADTTTNGGTSAFGADVETASITVAPINNAPVLDNSGDMALTDIAEDISAAANTGTAISAMLASGTVADPITDADAGAMEGLAVIAADFSNGAWQYDHDGDGVFDAFPTDLAEDRAVLLNDAAVIRFLPSANFNGTADITFRAWDRTSGANGDTGADTTANGGITAFSVNTETASVTVAPVNDAPAAIGDAYTAIEDEPLYIGFPGVLVNDSDAENNPVTAVLSSGPANGTVTLLADGSFTYIPNPNFNGFDSFQYSASDGTDDSASVAVSVTVAPVNDPPVFPAAQTPAHAVDEDGRLTVSPAGGLLQNGSDPDGDPLTAIVVAGPEHGEITLNPDGSFTYTPNPNYFGTDTFSYKISDGIVSTEPAIVRVTVNPVNDPPAVAGTAGVWDIVEEHGREIDAASLKIEDPDGVPPSGFTLSVGDGDNYTVAGITGHMDNTLCVVAGDIDGDGDTDLVFGNDGACRTVFNNGTAHPFMNAVISEIPGVQGSLATSGVQGSLAPSGDAQETTAMALGDVDGDGDLDLVVANADAPDMLWLNDGENKFSHSGEKGFSHSGNTTCVALGDLDGDGDLDLIFGYDGSPVRLYLNNGTDSLFETAMEIGGATRTRSIVLADMDGDGDPDLVVGNAGVNWLYLNNGTGNPFSTGIGITSDAHDTFSIAAGDVDGDGDIDLVAGNRNRPFGQANRLYLNNGTADPFNGVEGTDIPGEARNTCAVLLADVDNDGDSDLIEGNDLFQANRLYLNDGSANPFGEGRDMTGDPNNTRAMVVADLNGDGLPDLVLGNHGRANCVYLNNGTDTPFNGIPGTGNIVIPAADFSGTLTIPVTVSDGTANSAPYTLVLTVTPENDPPIIRGQKTRVTGVGESATVEIGDVELTDPDNTFPDDFFLTVHAGDNYTVSGNTVTPNAGFAGLLTVPVTANDGIDESEIYLFKITVDDDLDGDGMADAWELDHGLDPTIDDSGLDSDNDGYSNLEEYNAGTDPAVSDGKTDTETETETDSGGGGCFVGSVFK